MQSKTLSRTLCSSLIVLGIACLPAFAITNQTPRLPMQGMPMAPQGLAQTTPPQAELNEIHDAIHIPTVWSWLTPTLIGVGLALLIGFLWWQYRHKKSLVERIQETAAERARKRLRDVLNQVEQPERFCTVLSEIVRVYLEERFRIRAPEQTTEEFLADAQKSAVLDKKHQDLLTHFLEQCDLVKFAGHEPVREDLTLLHQTASDFVEETAFELPPVAEAIKTGVATR